MNIQRNIERYGKLAGITKKVTPHQLKHSTTTHFLNNGIDIRRIQHFLGHRSLVSTMIYASINNMMSRKQKSIDCTRSIK